MEHTSPPHKACQPGGQLQHAVTIGGNLAWAIYRTFLSGAAARVVPSYTRDACLQLFCDLRANTPKDARFASRHIKAFTPKTPAGWLALSATLAGSLSAVLLMLAATVSVSVAGVSIGLAALLAGGVFVACVLSFLGFVLFGSALGVGALACVALSAYVATAASLAVMRHIVHIVFGMPEGTRLHAEQRQTPQAPLHQQPHGAGWRPGAASAAAPAHEEEGTAETASKVLAHPPIGARQAEAAAGQPLRAARPALSQADAMPQALPVLAVPPIVTPIKTRRSATCNGKSRLSVDSTGIPTSTKATTAAAALISTAPFGKDSPASSDQSSQGRRSLGSSTGDGSSAEDVAPRPVVLPGSPSGSSMQLPPPEALATSTPTTPGLPSGAGAGAANHQLATPVG